MFLIYCISTPKIRNEQISQSLLHKVHLIPPTQIADIPAMPCLKQQKEAPCIFVRDIPGPGVSRRVGPWCARDILPKLEIFLPSWERIIWPPQTCVYPDVCLGIAHVSGKVPPSGQEVWQIHNVSAPFALQIPWGERGIVYLPDPLSRGRDFTRHMGNP